MITASSAFNAANAPLQKKPILLIEIEGYSRTFTNRAASQGGLAGSSNPSIPLNPVIQFGTAIVDFGGLGFAGSTARLQKPTQAGNILFAFLYWAGGPLSVPITDSAGNTWTQIYQHTAVLGGSFTVWTCVANAWNTFNDVTWDPAALYNHHNAEFYVVEVDAQYSGFAWNAGTGSGTAIVTAGATTISIPSSGSWNMFLAELAPASGAQAAVTLGFLSGSWLPYPFTTASAAGSMVFTADNATACDWLVSLDPLQETVSDLEGGSDLSDLVFNVQDVAQQITADFASFTFEGKQVVLLMGYVGMILSDYLPLFTGKIDSVASDNSNLEYKFICPDIRKDLSQVVYTRGDDGFATSSDHPHTINAHPLDILVDLLENQLGWPASIIDIAKIQQWRDTIYSGVQFAFRLASPPAAKEFIENEICKPLGAYHRTNNLGIFTLNFFYPINPQPVGTLDHSTLTELPVAQQADLINQAAWRFDYSDSGDQPGVERVISFDPSIKKYGLHGEHIVESKGLRSSFGGALISEIVSRLVFLRYASKQLQFDAAPNLWSECLFEPGDILSVTSALEPDREAGVLGITAKAFEVMGRTWEPWNGIASFKLLAVDLKAFKQSLITPNGEPDFTADTTLNKAKYLYLSDANGVYSDASPGNTLC